LQVNFFVFLLYENFIRFEHLLNLDIVHLALKVNNFFVFIPQLTVHLAQLSLGFLILIVVAFND